MRLNGELFHDPYLEPLCIDEFGPVVQIHVPKMIISGLRGYYPRDQQVWHGLPLAIRHKNHHPYNLELRVLWYDAYSALVASDATAGERKQWTDLIESKPMVDPEGQVVPLHSRILDFRREEGELYAVNGQGE